jgi:hypothetical protein
MPWNVLSIYLISSIRSENILIVPGFKILGMKGKQRITKQIRNLQDTVIYAEQALPKKRILLYNSNKSVSLQ